MKYILTQSTQHLKIPSIKVTRKLFPDQELYLKIQNSIKNQPSTLISNILPQNILEFLFTVNAVRHMGANIKQIIIPYLAYARQDKIFSHGEALSAEVILSLLENLKIPITIYDMHSEMLKAKYSFDYQSLLPALLKQIPKNNFIVISPDKGGIERAKKIAKLLKAQFKVISKQRIGNAVFMQFKGNVEGKHILIVDDIISTGETLVQAAKVLKSHGARDIYCIASHGLFVKNARQKLERSQIKKIVVSNSLPIKSSKKIQVIPIEPSIK